MNDDEGLKRIVDRSGFPFQIALAKEVWRTSSDHGYKVIFEEHAWRGPDGNDGFVDLVLEDRDGAVVLAVESKRTIVNDWIFLQTGAELSRKRDARGWITYTGLKPLHGWYELRMATGAPEAQFCVIPKEEKAAVSMLERIASELVLATEALAAEDLKLRPRWGESIRMHFSVIVTNARLRVGLFDAANVSLVDGATQAIQFEEIPVVMFRKQLSTKIPEIPTQAMRPSEIAMAKQHTVYIVHATAFASFLVDFGVMPESIREVRFNRG